MTTALLSPEVLAQGIGGGPDFQILTNAMEPDGTSPSGAPVLRMIGSSTIRDLQGDIMAMSALQDMCKVPDNLTIFLNHSYNLPDDVFGGLAEPPTIQIAGEVADLFIKVEVETDNPAALRTTNMIVRKGRRFGCSVGCQVLEYDLLDDGGIVIQRVETVEWSTVGVPACQRCWVENAISGYFSRTLAEGRGDDALKVAPAMQRLYSRDYERLIRHVTHPGLARDLEKIASRTPASHVLMWNPTSNLFELRGPRNVSKSLERSQVPDLLEGSGEWSELPMNKKQPPLPEEEPVDPEVLDATKAVSGNTGFPLMDIGTEWTGSKAESQIFSWAKNDDGEIIASKAKQCFLYYDPDNSDKQNGYKMPFCYIAGNSPKIVPLGVRACVGVLSGGMGGGKFQGGDAGMKAKCKTMYGRINSQFNPDPKWEVPWQKEDELEVPTTKDEEILDTEQGKDLIRQDLVENKGSKKDDDSNGKMPAASDVEVDSDGSHEPCNGPHSHAHPTFGSQKGDDMHKHTHKHDGDASHDHHGSDEEENNGSNDDEEKQKGHHHDDALLDIYNSIGKQLGLEPVSLEQKCNGDGYDLQSAVTLLSQADTAIDALMGIFGVPDMDKVNHPANPYPLFPSVYNLHVDFAKALNEVTVKEGRELNAKNRQIIAAMHDQSKGLHDVCKAMSPDCCKCADMGNGTAHQNTGTNTEDARQDAQYQMGQDVFQLAYSMDHLANALKELNLPGIQEELDSAQRGIDKLQEQLTSKEQEVTHLQQEISSLKDMPLGRPTGLQRSIKGEATYADMRAAGGLPLTLPEAVQQTTIIARGLTRYRHWPDGVAKDIRPLLTPDQKSFMRIEEIIAYQDGGEAYVPLIDDPVVR